MPYTLGLDISTTATKALLINDAGQVVAGAASNYGFETPHPLWSEQDPALWWDGAVHSIRAVLARSGVHPAEVRGVGLTGQMHGLVLLDATGQVLRPAILWNDQRTAEECAAIHARVGKDRLLERTGNHALTGFTAPKLLWVRSHEPAVYRRIAQVLLPKDYVRFRLTGAYATDKAGAAGTLLMDLQRRDWSEEVLKALEIPMDWLPPTFEGPTVTGQVTTAASETTGLRPGTSVVAGGGDQAAQAVGVGAVREGVMAVTLGTSGVVFAPSQAPHIEPEGRLHAFCHAVPECWHLMGVMLSAAGSLRWYRDTLAPDLDYDTLLAEAAEIPPGSEGLCFLPYLTGERTPHPDPLARGAFVGLTVRHHRGHLTRAVLEGVAFGLKDSFRLMQAAGLPPTEQVRLSGGGARSALWRQIIADILDAALVTVNTTEGAAFGAALLAGVGAGLWTDVETACDAIVSVKEHVAPDPEAAARYASVYDVYTALYPALKPSFAALSQ